MRPSGFYNVLLGDKWISAYFESDILGGYWLINGVKYADQDFMEIDETVK